MRKLGIRPGHRVYVREECADLLAAIVPHLATNVTATKKLGKGERVDIVLLRPSEDELGTLFERAKSWIVPNGAVWVVVRKKPYRQGGDVTFEAAQAAALPTGLVDNKECTVSETEYATRYVLRRELRPKA